MKLIHVDICKEEITISYKGTQDDIEIVHWVQDEWIEDPALVVPAIANAIHLAHTNPAKLIEMNEKHIQSQLEINK